MGRIKRCKYKTLECWGWQRLAEKNKKFDQNFIELARNVYKFNDVRARIKSKINELSGSNIKEIKQHPKY